MVHVPRPVCSKKYPCAQGDPVASISPRPIQTLSTGQLLHADCPGSFWYEPGAHRFGAIAPASHEAPRGQLEHATTEEDVSLEVKVPAGHGDGAELPSIQKLP